jgi:hypothetical protein
MGLKFVCGDIEYNVPGAGSAHKFESNLAPGPKSEDCGLRRRGVEVGAKVEKYAFGSGF